MNLANKIFYLLFLPAVLIAVSSCHKPDKNSCNAKNLKNNWHIQSSDSIQASGQEISSSGYEADSWYPAQVPSTVLHVLVSDGIYKDIFKNDNLEYISNRPFRSSWW